MIQILDLTSAARRLELPFTDMGKLSRTILGREYTVLEKSIKASEDI